MESDKLAFWGIALKPGEPADLDLRDGETLHVTMASYGVELADTKGRSVVSATVQESGGKHGLAVLNAGSMESRVMDVTFVGEESLTFEVSGKNVVHLVGSFSFENEFDSDDSDSDDGEGLIGVYDDEMESDDEDGDEPRLLHDSDPPVITEVKDDDDDPEEESAGKKVEKVISAKKKKDKKELTPNGKHKSAAASDEGKSKAVVAPKSQKKDAAKKRKDGKAAPPPKAVKILEEEDEEESEDEEDDDDDDNAMPLDKMKEVYGISPEDDESESEDENPKGDPSDEDEVTPKSGKTKRGKKRRVANGASQEPTPPSTKRSKVSDRPGTPAAIKTTQKSKGDASVGKDRKKQGQANGKAVAKAAEEEKATTSDDGTPSKSGKKRRRKSKKGGNAA